MAKSFVVAVALVAVFTIQGIAARSIRSEPPFRQQSEGEDQREAQGGLTEKEMRQEFNHIFEAVEEAQDSVDHPLSRQDLQQVELELEQDPKFLKFANIVDKEYEHLKKAVHKRNDDGTTQERYPDLWNRKQG